MNKEIEQIGVDTWNKIKDEVSQLPQGQIIEHQWFRQEFNICEPDISNYKTTEEFIRALDLERFKYMSIIDILRWEILEEKQICLVNERGEGYKILPSGEQTKWAYENVMNSIKKEIRQAKKIIDNVLPVSQEQQTIDTNLKNKFDTMRHMILLKRR